MKNLKKLLNAFLADSIIRCVRIYQKIISPDHSIYAPLFGMSRCRFFPSCSEYLVESIRQYGLLYGSMASLKRISRCNPFHAGGYDPVI